MSECEHMSATGVDQTDARDAAKVWRCDGCGFTYRERVIEGVTFGGALAGGTLIEAVPVVPCSTCEGSGEVVLEGEFTRRDGSQSTNYRDQCPTCSSTGWVEAQP